MKRILMLFLAAVLMIPGMAACGSAPSSGGEDSGEVPNPMAQISLTQFQKDTGFQVDLYDGYELGEVYKINTEPVIYGLNLSDENGLEYDVRMAKTENLVEISGMNYPWTYTNDPQPVGDEEEPTEGEEPPAEEEEEEPLYYYYLTDQGQGMITWYEDNFSWSVSMTKNASLDALEQIYDDIYGMVSF